jgi:uncharacterized repeat protein (TIGR01451 family)
VSIVPGSYEVSGDGSGCAAPAQAFDGQANNALLSGGADLAAGQSCLVRFTVRADFGANPVPTTPLLQTAYGCGTADDATANPGYTFPGGTPTPPIEASTTDVSTDATTVIPGATPGTPAAPPSPPAAPGSDTPTPTPFSLSTQRLGIAKRVLSVNTLSAGNLRAVYQLVIVNTGNQPAPNVQVRDTLTSTFPAPAQVVAVSAVTLVSGDPALCVPNAGFSLSQPQLLDGLQTWPVGTGCTLRFSVDVATQGASGPWLNTALASSHAAPPTQPGGTPVGTPLAQDSSDSGADPSGTNPGEPGDTGGSDDPTPLRAPGGISGSVWLDSSLGAAGNRRRDSGEAGLPGWIVQALYPAGTTINGSNVGGQVALTTQATTAQASTGADGRYSLPDLPAGTYNLRFLAPGSLNAGGATWGMPVNGENGQPQPASTLDTATRSLRVVLSDAALVPEQSLPVEPSGVIYDSQTRQPVTGATVSLLDATGSPLPAGCLLPGQQSQVTSSGLAAGFYRFDLLPGAATACPASTTRYQISVTPPAGYTFPSTALPAAAALGQQPAGLYAVVPQPAAPQGTDPTTHHLLLDLGAGAGDVIHNHLPLDPATVAGNVLVIEKLADRRQAEIGDIVNYSIRVRNAGLTPLPAGTVTDRLPLGFKAVAGSMRQWLGTVATPVADAAVTGWPGPVMSWGLPALAAGQEVRYTYRVRLGFGAERGDGTNRALAQAGGVVSNEALAVVRVDGGVFAQTAQVIGKVFVDCNQNKVQDAGEWGIPGVRIVMEDGTSVTTDDNGLFSLQGLRPITHVLRVDPRTMPVGSRLGTTSSRNAADPESLFIDLKNGELHRAEFREQSCYPKVMQQVRERRAKAPPLEPFVQTGRDDPWGLRFDSNEHPLKRTPAIEVPQAPAPAKNPR